MPKPQLYDDNLSNDLILQGDIFTEIEFFITDFESKAIKNKNQDDVTEIVLHPSGTGSLTSHEAIPKEPSLKQYSEKRLVAIVSQTCDIADSEFVV